MMPVQFFRKLEGWQELRDQDTQILAEQIRLVNWYNVCLTSKRPPSNPSKLYSFAWEKEVKKEIKQKWTQEEKERLNKLWVTQ